jgi:hypothetical protein
MNPHIVSKIGEKKETIPETIPHTFLRIIQEVTTSEDQRLDEGKYLELCNVLGELHVKYVKIEELEQVQKELEDEKKMRIDEKKMRIYAECEQQHADLKYFVAEINLERTQECLEFVKERDQERIQTLEKRLEVARDKRSRDVAYNRWVIFGWCGVNCVLLLGYGLAGSIERLGHMMLT